VVFDVVLYAGGADVFGVVDGICLCCTFGRHVDERGASDLRETPVNTRPSKLSVAIRSWNPRDFDCWEIQAALLRSNGLSHVDSCLSTKRRVKLFCVHDRSVDVCIPVTASRSVR
jgi:hypothetical protein